MGLNENNRPRTQGIRARRIITAMLAVGGLAGSLAASGVADASVQHAKGVVVSTARSSKVGTVLVSGKTVYTLKASKTACSTACLKIWPELVLPKGVNKATAGSGVTASKLGTISRANGVKQVTYGGKPLYLFVGDKKSGQVNGNVSDTWGTWSDVVTVKPTTSSPTTTTAPSTGGVAF